MRSPGSRSLLGFLAVLALLATACSTSTTSNTPTATGSSGTPTAAGLAKTSCQFSPSNGVTCYTLTVPQDRTNPTGAKVQLAIAVVKGGSSSTPPVFYLQGGPGGNSIDFFAGQVSHYNLSWSQLNNALFGNRTLILLDQRGTGYSKPSLDCPEVNALQYQTSSNAPLDQQLQTENAAISACQSRLTTSGVDLADYTSYTDANDVHDVINALGYSSVDLYGVSYGTRLALEVMRSFPQKVRSVVLDSTVPAQLGLLTNIPYSTARVFKTLWDGCAADASCNANYPNLEQTFYSVYNALNANPITFQTNDQNFEDPKYNQNFTVYFNGDSLVSLLFTAFYDVSAIPELPQMIYQLKVRDTTIAANIYGQDVFDSSVSWGMYYSVECAEDVNFDNDSSLSKAAANYPDAIRQNQLASIEGELQSCAIWKVPSVSFDETQPVTSSIPTLILEGEYDPVTPPSNGDLVAQTLSKSYTFLFPGVGHGVMFSDGTLCATKVTQAFWANPTSKPNGSCIASVPEPNFK